MIPIFIGYDPREGVALSVLTHSLHRRSSQPLAVTPLVLGQLAGLLTRPRDSAQSTDFAISRFLVPHLAGPSGWSIYMDSDMLALEDPAQLWSLRDERFAVMVVQHDHVPAETTKFLGEPQRAYARKNWSSLMLFNNARCRALTPAYVNAAPGLDLHQFRWVDDAEIGALPPRWNHLVGVMPHDPAAALVHYTLGGPYFPETRECRYAEEWRAEHALMTRY
jgi:hypothetical protein